MLARLTATAYCNAIDIIDSFMSHNNLRNNTSTVKLRDRVHVQFSVSL